MSGVSILNPKADVVRKKQAFVAQFVATEGLLSCFHSNLGPKGTFMMIVGGAGQIKITKDGSCILSDVQLVHPSASVISRAATAQDATTGDGTTSTIVLIGELMRQCEKYVMHLSKHPRLIVDGIIEGKYEALKCIEQCKIPVENISRKFMEDIARSSLCTKLDISLVDKLTSIVVDSIACIQKSNEQLDLFMVEILSVKRGFAMETRFINGMVMDHGARHPDMPKRLKNCYVLTCNVSLEYEKTEVNSGFFYSSVEQRNKLVSAERQFTDIKVQKIIDLKNKVCTPENKMSFVVFNQKGIDPISLDMLSKEGIMALRRVKRRNMERLTLCCGGNPVNSVYDLTVEDLGFAGEVYEESIEDEKWTYVEQVKNPKSCTILINGPSQHVIDQVKDAIRDGLRAVKNCIDDKALLPGAGAPEIATYVHLQNCANKLDCNNHLQYGISALSEAILSLPRTLCLNAGLDAEVCIRNAVDHYKKTNELVGIDLNTGAIHRPELIGVYDNYNVKRQMITLSCALTEKILLVDEIIKAGKQMSKSSGLQN